MLGLDGDFALCHNEPMNKVISGIYQVGNKLKDGSVPPDDRDTLQRVLDARTPEEVKAVWNEVLSLGLQSRLAPDLVKRLMRVWHGVPANGVPA